MLELQLYICICQSYT